MTGWIVIVGLVIALVLCVIYKIKNGKNGPDY